MPQLAEDAIKLAILQHPQTFGLTQAAVNPMLLFLLERIEEGEGQITEETWKVCFDVVNTTLHQKVIEVFTGLSVIQGKAQERVLSLVEPTPRPAPEPKAEPALPRKSGNGKPASQSEVIGTPGRVLSVKQLRYLGYLIRQTGQEPDYTEIQRMSQKDATLRIKALEASVKGEVAAR